MKLAIAMGLAATLLAPGATPQQESQSSQRPAPIERRGPDRRDPDRRDAQIPVITVESRLVPIAMNVVDEHGAPVGGLNADQFEITEDGKPQKIAVFDRESATPLSIVLSIDASESVLSDQRLEREAARKFVRSLLRPQDELDLMDFADEVRELVPFTSDIHRIEAGFSRITHGDATALYDAVFLGSERLRDTRSGDGRRRVLVLITDGDNTTHHGSYDAALEQAQRAGAMVYALIIVPIAADAGRNTAGEHALIQMANDTGGKFYYVEDRTDLAPAFQHVSDDLRTQYTLAYYAPQKGGDRNGFRRIHIQLRDPGLRAKYTLRYRTGYYAEKR